MNNVNSTVEITGNSSIMEVSCKTGSNTPVQYRLCIKQTGESILQGLFTWNEVKGGTILSCGQEWKDIPTHIESEG